MGGTTEFHLGFGGVHGGLLSPYWALFAPLEVLYGTRFGSKHHILVLLAKLYWIDITDPFLGHRW